jgi:hypothetical protein
MNEPIFVGKDIEFDKIDNEEKIKAIIKNKLRKGMGEFRLFVANSKTEALKIMRKHLQTLLTGLAVGIGPLTAFILAIKLINDEVERREQQQKK